MRLWSLHPQLLDARGLVALWREALLAQAVLRGQTRGYLHHPQLLRFRASPEPLRSMGSYLREIHAEAARRGYRFDATKLGRAGQVQLAVTRQQLEYEWRHLETKLGARAPEWLAQSRQVALQAHPLFRVIEGPVESWEIVARSGVRKHGD